MSSSGKNLAEVYDDIDLCYKVMGLTFSDPPDKVDRVYKGLVAEYTKAVSMGDPASRQTAKANLEQIQELYERITSSLIYKDYAREYEKYRQLKSEEMEAKKKKHELEKASMVACPSCGKLISASVKICIYCHKKIPSQFELLMDLLFSKKVMIPFIVLLILAGAAILYVTGNIRF